MGRRRHGPEASRQALFGTAGELLRDRARVLRQRDQQERVMEEEETASLEASRLNREPLSPSRWIENEYFCGHLARDMFATLKKDFCDVYERNVFEVVMGGSTGWGKTWFALACQAYSMYLLTCYGVPQRAFRGMVESAQILYMSLNTKKEKAFRAYFTQLDTLLKSIPYFQRDFPMQPNMVHEIRLPQKHITATYSGATKTAAESENLIFCVMDEVNLYDLVEKSARAVGDGERYDAAEVIYASALGRMQNRFMLPDSTMPRPSKMIMLCKETYPDSFIRRRVKYAREHGEEAAGKVKIMEYAEWDTRPLGTYEAKYFWVKTETRKESPRIIEDEAEAAAEKRRVDELKASGASDDELFEVIRAPLAGGAYLKRAQMNLSDFIRDACGRPTESLKLFFKEREHVFAAHRKPEDGFGVGACSHPFSAEVTNFYDGVFLIKERLAEQVEDGRWRPFVNPGTPRFIGIDTSISGDPCGFAVGHVSGWVEKPRAMQGGAVKMQRAVVFYADAVLRILPPPGGEVPYAAILGMVRTFKELGFRIERVGLDQFQRIALSQPLEAEGFEWERVSTDDSTKPSEGLRSAYREGRMSLYEYRPLEEELVALEEKYTGKVKDGVPVVKVDHPTGGKKDVVDALTRAQFLAEKWGTSVRTPPPMTKASHDKGAPRGYQVQEAFDKGDWDMLMELTRDGRDDY